VMTLLRTHELTSGVRRTMVPATRLVRAVRMVAGQRDEIPRPRSDQPSNGGRWRSRRRRAVAREAEFLDGLVDDQLRFIRQLPMSQRDGLAEALSALVMLAQDHRHYGQGWISRRELRRRVEHALTDLDTLLCIPGSAAAVSHPE
ncbi:MAG: hypothetical protein ACRDRG_02680, partial [Pseudonocardiaceae bacterium]